MVCSNCLITNVKGIKINPCSECFEKLQSGLCYVKENTNNGQTGAVVNYISDSDKIISETSTRKNKTIFDMLGAVNLNSNKNSQMIHE